MNTYMSEAEVRAAIEIRSSRRISAFLLAFVEVDGNAWPVCLRNLSAAGALVEAEAGFAVGSNVLFRRAFAAVPAKVVWAKGGRFGLAFHQLITANDVSALSRRIVSNRP